MLCAQYQVHFRSVCKNRFTYVNLYCNIVHVANFCEFEPQRCCSTTSGQPYYADPSSEVFPNSPPWPPKQILHAIRETWMPCTTQHMEHTARHRPTIQRNTAAPPFPGHVTVQESVVVTLYYSQKSVRVFFCLSFPIYFGTTCDESE